MSNLINGINFSLNSLEDFDDRKLAERVIRSILAGPRFAVPKKYGREQPLKQIIDERDITPLIDLWAPSQKNNSNQIKFPDGLLLMEFASDGDYLVHWKKAPVPSFAGVSGGGPWPTLNQEAKRLGEFMDLVKVLIGLVNPVYGEIQNMALPGWDIPFDLPKRLPDVPWISIYGVPYIKMFTEERILSAPFWKTEQLPSGHFLLQSTESPHQKISEETKSAIRRHLGEDAFMSGGRWRYKDGHAPVFDFSKVMNRQQP